MQAANDFWYKDTLIYQLHVKAFCDSDGDGLGDFPGLTRKLDYIRDLGATTIWLLPFYPSPLRDDGYDISDYKNIHPSYGTMRDFRAFVRAAHERGLRIITELVINHTSDQHPWFQRARRAKPGSSQRDFYVWSDNDRKFAGTPIIFSDTETSNWAWDPVAGAYYWHRFFSHQPDLNFGNPLVIRAVIGIMRFWLKLGVDGMRLDAIPFLCVREGTDNENLPETHAVIKILRSVIENEFPGRVFLAEANQWPEDVRAYFGDGDECQMAFHFPLMPRMFMAIAEEDRYPIIDILRQTPEIPSNCQWAIFLRNHDEMTLEMLTERERAAMYRIYATDPRARVNIGIRRRLAPLMENDRPKIELMTALLLSMPGTPIIYYGDEIGMGDNIYLRDRDGVRTPMQWSIDRNGGFSSADPARLYLAPIMDSLYGYHSVNVERQMLNPSSLLHWMRKVIAVRQAHPVFGRGSLEFLRPANRKVLAYVREYENDVVLCVANLARSPQAVALDLSRFAGRIPIEMIGWSPFPRIREERYLFTLPGHAFFWFVLSPEAEAIDVETEPPERLPELPTLVVMRGDPSSLTTARNRVLLERDILPSYFGQPEVRVEAATALGTGFFLLCRAGEERTVLALSRVELGAIAPPQPIVKSALARARWGAKEGLLCEGFASEAFARSVVAAMREEHVRDDGNLRLIGSSSEELNALSIPADTTVRRLPEREDASQVVLGDSVLLRFFRTAESLPEPHVELAHHLKRAGFTHVPDLLGTLEIREGDAAAVCTARAFIENSGDGWSSTLAYLERTLPSDDHELFMERVHHYGVRLAQLHRALGEASDEEAFKPEVIPAEQVEVWRAVARTAAQTALRILENPPVPFPAGIQEDAALLFSRRDALLGRIESFSPRMLGKKQRIHGRFHLGNILLVAGDIVITGIGGEASLSRAERRSKQSPLHDVAAMERSLRYVAVAASYGVTAHRAGNVEIDAAAARAWRSRALDSFWAGYQETIEGFASYPEDAADARSILDFFIFTHALEEIPRETAHRPEWLRIPFESCLER
jgi:maltose alpha-D-glucosyltransferase/alpha-amylase